MRVDDPALHFTRILRPDPVRIARAFHRAAPGYAGRAQWIARMGEMLLERTQGIRFQPARILDLGCGPAVATRALAAQFPSARVVGLDLSPAMLRAGRGGMFARLFSPPPPLVAGNALSTPFASASMDLVYANMLLHWLPDLPAALREVRRILAPGGLFLFNMIGQEHFREFHQAVHVASGEFARDVPQLPVPPIHVLGDLLLSSGFILPVVDRERETLTVPSVVEFLRLLRGLGAGSPFPPALPGLSSRPFLRRVEEIWRGDGEALTMTTEVLFGIGWKQQGKEQKKSP